MSSRYNISDHDGVQTLLGRLGLSLDADKFWPRYNVSPLTALWAVYGEFENAKMSPVEWAMVPLWAKPDQFPKPLTVARAETAWERASFKSLIRRYRVIVPVNGFYLWSRKGSGSRAWHLHSQDGSALAVGGLRMFSADGIMQICVLTCEDEKSWPDFGSRMPVLIDDDSLDEWLHTEKRERIDAMMRAGPAARLVAEEVSPKVIDPAFEDPRCVEPINA